MYSWRPSNANLLICSFLLFHSSTQLLEMVDVPVVPTVCDSQVPPIGPKAVVEAGHHSARSS